MTHSLSDTVDIAGVEYVPLCCAVAAVAEAEQRGYQNGQWSTQQYHADKDYNRGLSAAREAVAALRKAEATFYVAEVQNAYDMAALHALAAIDALKEKP